MTLRRKCFIVIFFAMLLCKTTVAQQTMVDSLLSTLKNVKDDAKKVDAYLAIAEAYRNIAPDSTASFAQKSLQLSQKTGNKTGECISLSIIGTSYYLKEDANKALKYYEQSYKIAEAERLDKEVGPLLSNMASVYFAQGRNDTAISLYKTAYERDEKSGNKKGMAIRLNNLSSAYFGLGDYNRAIDYVFKGIVLFKEIKDPVRVAISYNNVAQMFEGQKEYTKALTYFREAEKILLAENQYNPLAEVYSNMGNVSLKLDSAENAKIYLKKAIYYSDKYSQNECGHVRIKISLAKTFLALKQTDSAQAAAEKLLVSTPNCQTTELTKGNAHLVLGQVFAEYAQWGKAEDEALKSYVLFSALSGGGFKSERSEAAMLLTLIYKNRKEYEKALNYSTIYHQIQDSLFNESNIREITRLEAEHNFALEKQAIDAKNQEDALVLTTKVKQQKIARNLTIAVGLVAVIFMLVFLRLSRLRQRAIKELDIKNLLISEQKEEIEKTNTEMVKFSECREFFMQMIAHDLKNPLTAIHALSTTTPSVQNSERIKFASGQMYRLVANMLDVRKFEDAGLTLKKTKNCVVELMAGVLEANRFLLQTKNITVEFVPGEAVFVEIDKDPMARVFENLITNAVKYSSPGSKIVVKMDYRKADSSVVITFSDNGTGIHKEHLVSIFEKYWQVNPDQNNISASTGLGLAFCKMVIEAHNGSIEADSTVGVGTTFNIVLPNAIKGEAIHTVEGEVPVCENVIVPLEYESEPKVMEWLKEMKQMKVFQAGKINEMLERLEEYRVNQLWKGKILACVFNGDQYEFDKLLAMA